MHADPARVEVGPKPLAAIRRLESPLVRAGAVLALLDVAERARDPVWIGARVGADSRRVREGRGRGVPRRGEEPEGAGRALEADTAYLTAVGSVPITDKFSAYAKAGFHAWNLDDAIPGLTGNNDDSGTDPTYGVGVQYRFTDNLALRGEYSRFEMEDLDQDLAQLQVRFDF